MYSDPDSDPGYVSWMGKAITSGDAGDVHGPWGWTQFFLELSNFLESLERQYGIANQSFAEYAVNRLSLSLRNSALLLT